MDSSAIKSFLENSNQNGFGFLVVIVLFYLFFFFLIQYFHHKKRFYLLYSLYALVNGTNLLKHMEGVFFSDFFDAPENAQFILFLHHPAQLFGTLLFTFFIIDIMQLKRSYPKSVGFISYLYLVISVIYLGLWIHSIAIPTSHLIKTFQISVFLTTGYIVFFWLFYMIIKQKVSIKWYIISGMTVLVVAYFIISYFSSQEGIEMAKVLYIFYIGILVESLFFALAIGLEQKEVYKEKMAVQKKYASQLKENQIIKDSINRALSEELAQTKSNIVEISATAQRERTEKLTMKFENKFSQLRLDALRNQMNPHFIFNALNSIKSYMIENNQEKAIFYLNQFSKLIRSILESSREEQISLAEELKILKMYIEIENDRFKNDIGFSLEVNKAIDATKVKVPALFLQPFVENAIWHGLSTKKGKKKLSVKVSKSNIPEILEISIEDNGVGRKITKERNANNPFKKSSLGLTLTRDRLELFSKKFGKHYAYTIEDLFDKSKVNSEGTKVLVKIPEAT